MKSRIGLCLCILSIIILAVSLVCLVTAEKHDTEIANSLLQDELNIPEGINVELDITLKEHTDFYKRGTAGGVVLMITGVAALVVGALLWDPFGKAW